jgi:hypothetical protein
MITIETKIKDLSPRTALDACAALFAKIAHCLYVDLHIRNMPLNELKSDYQRKYGISSRHFNSIRYEVDGKARACAEKEKLLIVKKEQQIKHTEKRFFLLRRR